MISAVGEFHFTYWRASRLTDLLYLGLRYCQSRGSCSSPVNTLHLHSCINALFICFVFVADMQWGRAQPLPCYSTVALMHYLFVLFCCRYAVEESPAENSVQTGWPSIPAKQTVRTQGVHYVQCRGVRVHYTQWHGVHVYSAMVYIMYCAVEYIIYSAVEYVMYSAVEYILYCAMEYIVYIPVI